VGAPRDERDRQILRLLQADAWLTYAALAQQVNLSASAVQRRVERLIADGVLLGAHAEVAEEASGELTVYLLAELVDDSSQTIRKFAQAIRGAAEVREARYVTGEADVVLKLQVSDMRAYDRFVSSYVNDGSVVRRFKTFAALRALV
jgi:DNA-binding Lrp family transcriptional regulator